VLAHGRDRALRHRVELVAPREQQQVGHVRVRDEGVHGMADGEERLARGDPREPALRDITAELDQERRAHGRGGDHGLGAGGAPRLLEQEHEIDLVEAETTTRFGDEHAGHAELSELLPELRAAPRLGLPERAHERGRALLGEEIAQRLLEEQLVFVEAEPHG
jgi:hypothetical protein